MEYYVRAFLSGVAIGGVSYVMFEANKFTLKKLWDVNCIAAKLAGEMIKVAHDGEGCLKVVVVKSESESESESES